MKKIVLFMVMLAIVSWGMASQADPTIIKYVCGFYSTVNGEGHISNSKGGEDDWRISKNVAVYLDGEKSSLSALEGKPLILKVEFTFTTVNNKDDHEAVVMRARIVSKEEAVSGVVPAQDNMIREK